MTPAAWKKGIIVVIILVIILVLGFFAYLAFQFEQGAGRSERHDFHYSIDLSYSRTIENVTILLPVPELNGSPFIADMVVQGSVDSVPEGWNFSIDVVNGTPMLAIRAERMVPEYHGYPIAIEPGQSPLPTTVAPGTEYSPKTPILMPVQFGVMLAVNRTIDTHDPFGREPLFARCSTFTPYQDPVMQHRGTWYSYTTPVYLDHSSDPGTEVSIHTAIQGTNSIWRGGWIYNSYQDTLTLESVNGTGWIDARGNVNTGEGVYYSRY